MFFPLPVMTQMEKSGFGKQDTSGSPPPQIQMFAVELGHDVGGKRCPFPSYFNRRLLQK